jgi:hypothetical protein
MTKIGRFNLNEITFNRVCSAIKTRLLDIPHSIDWQFNQIAYENRSKIKSYKNIHQGKRCFIVANGPSLAKTNLDLLTNEYTFGMNRIYLYSPKSTFRPSYYVAVNELVLEQFYNEIIALAMPKFLNWNQRKNFKQHHGEIIYLKPKNVLSDSFQTDLTKPMVFGATVTFVTLQLAYYLGFKKVVLVGLDHDYAETGTPNKTEIRMYEEDKSHFHPNYFPKGIKWQLPDLKRSELEYEVARNLFSEDNREIVDATIEGKCSIFPKVNYESLF